MKKQDLSTLVKTSRFDFTKGVLQEPDAKAEPFAKFSEWLQQAFDAGNQYANAMTLSTCGSDGMPSARIMLLRDVSHGGFTFFTNYGSRKGDELKENNQAALLFFWPESERQVRIQGKVKRLPPAESDAYFATRPFDSQAGAWASMQSRPARDRAELDLRFESRKRDFEGKTVPRPPYWGGYVLVPSLFEFWQGRSSRMHDRFEYARAKSGSRWKVTRLMP